MLDEYRCVSDKYNSLFTIIICNKNNEFVVEKIEQQINKVKGMSNGFKKKYILNRLHNFIEYLENYEKPKICSIILIGKDVDEIKLTKKQVKTINEYNIPQYIFLYGNTYDINYVNDLFTNFDFYNVIEIQQKKITHTLLNKTKIKKISNFTFKTIDLFNKYINNVDDRCLIHGTSSILKKIKYIKHIVQNKKLQNNEIIDMFNQMKITENHKELGKCFDMLGRKKDMHLVIYGRWDVEIKEAIEQYRVKQLFCSIPILQKLKNIIPSGCFNFIVTKIEQLENNDIGHKLIHSYDGAIAIAYY